MDRHRICWTEAEEVTERPAVGASPRDRSVRIQAFDGADEKHPEEDTRAARQVSQKSRRRRSTEFLGQRVEAVLGQPAIERRGERMAGRFRQVRGHDEDLQLPFPTRLPECHAPPWVCLRSGRSRRLSSSLRRRRRGPRPASPNPRQAVHCITAVSCRRAVAGRPSAQAPQRTVREVCRLAVARALLNSETRASPETLPERWQKAPWQRAQTS